MYLLLPQDRLKTFFVWFMSFSQIYCLSFVPFMIEYAFQLRDFHLCFRFLKEKHIWFWKYFAFCHNYIWKVYHFPKNNICDVVQDWNSYIIKDLDTSCIRNGHNNGANASFSVQSKIFPKLEAQILQMRYQSVPACSSFTVERKKFCNFQFILSNFTYSSYKFLPKCKITGN